MGSFYDHVTQSQARLLATPAGVGVDRSQTSCGYGVPVFDYVGQRSKAGRGRACKEPKQVRKGALAE